MNARLIMTVEEMQNHEAWLGMRNKGIGGSDAGVIMGDNQWKSKYQLWLEKTGQARPEGSSPVVSSGTPSDTRIQSAPVRSV